MPTNDSSGLDKVNLKLACAVSERGQSIFKSKVRISHGEVFAVAAVF